MCFIEWCVFVRIAREKFVPHFHAFICPEVLRRIVALWSTLILGGMEALPHVIGVGNIYVYHRRFPHHPQSLLDDLLPDK